MKGSWIGTVLRCHLSSSGDVDLFLKRAAEKGVVEGIDTVVNDTFPLEHNSEMYY